MQTEMSFSELASPITFVRQELAGVAQKIHELAVLRSRKYKIAESDLLQSIMDVDHKRIFEKLGYESLTAYCEKELGLSDNIAGLFVRVARKSQVIPEIKEALDEGLGLTKVRSILPVITKDNHHEWLERAQTCSRVQLDKMVATFVPQAQKPEKAKPQGANRTRLEFEIDDETLRMQKRAQDLVSQKLGHSANLAETQKELLKVYLEKMDPVAKARRIQNRKSDPSREWSPARKANVVKAAKTAARSSRPKIPAGVQQAVNLRDQQKCQAQLPDGSRCGKSRWVHLHHLKPVHQGGGNTPENLITLCSAHHRLWHSRGSAD